MILQNIQPGRYPRIEARPAPYTRPVGGSVHSHRQRWHYNEQMSKQPHQFEMDHQRIAFIQRFLTRTDLLPLEMDEFYNLLQNWHLKMLL